MATPKLKLHELCYPGVPFPPWKHISSPPPTKGKTLQEYCYPDITYEHLNQYRQNKLKSSLSLEERCYSYTPITSSKSQKSPKSLADYISEQVNSNWSDTDPIISQLSFADDIEQRKLKIKTVLLKFKYQEIDDPDAFLANLEEQITQLEKLVNENRTRETLLNESISDPIPNQFILSDLEISTHVPEQLIHDQSNPTTYVDNRSPLTKLVEEILNKCLEETLTLCLNPDLIPVQTIDNSKFNQVEPVSIPSDSTSNFPIQFESEPPPFHLTTLSDFELKTQHDEDPLNSFIPWYKVPYDQFYNSNKVRKKPSDHSSIFEDEHWYLDDLFKEDQLPDNQISHPELLNEPFVDTDIIPESSNLPCYDISPDLPCYDIYDDDLIFESSDVPIYDIYVDELFNPDELLNFDLDTHTHSVEQLKPFCMCICVEDELQSISNNVEDLVHKPKLPFKNIALDLVIFSFDEPLAEPYLDVNDQSLEEDYDKGPIWDDEIMDKPQFIISEGEILEDELSVYNNHILTHTTLELHELKKLWRITITKIQGREYKEKEPGKRRVKIEGWQSS